MSIVRSLNELNRFMIITSHMEVKVTLLGSTSRSFGVIQGPENHINVTLGNNNDWIFISSSEDKSRIGQESFTL